MGFDGLLESSVIIEALKTLISTYDKKCTTVYALADQIMGMERSEKELFKIPQDTFLHLQSIIMAKMMEELHNLSLIILNMEEQKSSVESVVSRMESLCQSVLERGSHDALEYQELQTVYSISNYVNAVIDIKWHHLETMNCNDISSILKARKDSSCKGIEKELDRYIMPTKKKEISSG